MIWINPKAHHVYKIAVSDFADRPVRFDRQAKIILCVFDRKVYGLMQGFRVVALQV